MSKVAKLRPDQPALPKPQIRPEIPHPEDWAAWCEHPVTRFVATAHKLCAELQRDEWTRVSWTGGHADPLALTELRTRADAYMAFLETTLETYAKLIETP